MRLPLLLVVAVTLPLTHLLAQGDPLASGDQGGVHGHSRFWTYYDPYPSNYMGSRSWWNGHTLSGDWWGIRNYLDDSGVAISASYTNNIAGNPVGGTSAGFTYCDNVSFGLELDFEKLANWHGLTLIVSGLNRAGSNLSQQNIGNQFTVQQVYGGQTAMFYALDLEQKFLDDKVALKVGRFATGDDFGSSPLYWLYMNNGIDGNPQALPVNTQFSAYPWAVWAARLRINPSPEWNALFGAYQVSSRVFNPVYHGLDWSIRSDDGILLISQFGWTPEFAKKPVTVDSVPDGKSVASGKNVVSPKSFKSVTPHTEMKGLPGHYWFGVYYSPWQFAQFGSSDTATNSYGFYWHADQMVWQESPGSDQGLTLWSSFVFSPQQNIAKLPFQANAGIVYKGLIPTRDNDFSMLGFVYGKFSKNYARTVEAAGNGYPQYEIVLEATYRINLSQFVYFQPDLQYVINPGGTGNIQNALVLGAQMGVTF
jgi:porin